MELRRGGASACPPRETCKLPETTFCAKLQPPAPLCEPAAFCWACENRWLLFKGDAEAHSKAKFFPSPPHRTHGPL